MEEKSMTALVSSFARWYHAENNDTKVFDDFLAGSILTEEEKNQISYHMSNGIEFFNPLFDGSSEEALRWIVDNELSPTTLGRSAWAEKALCSAVEAGASQYLIVAAGYDTFAHRQPTWASGLRVYELDHPVMSRDKQARAQRMCSKKPDGLTYLPIDLASESLADKLCACSAYKKDALSFFSLLGISYYLPRDDFMILIKNIADSSANGSAVVFDYPDKHVCTKQARKQSMLASGAGEVMLASYSCGEINDLLSDCGFFIHEHLTPDEITVRYFNEYNSANPTHPITAFKNVNYCRAVLRAQREPFTLGYRLNTSD
jgi:methyltransferase (TIGR00027 family)